MTFTSRTRADGSEHDDEESGVLSVAQGVAGRRRSVGRPADGETTHATDAPISTHKPGWAARTFFLRSPPGARESDATSSSRPPTFAIEPTLGSRNCDRRNTPTPSGRSTKTINTNGIPSVISRARVGCLTLKQTEGRRGQSEDGQPGAPPDEIESMAHGGSGWRSPARRIHRAPWCPERCGTGRGHTGNVARSAEPSAPRDPDVRSGGVPGIVAACPAVWPQTLRWHPA